MAENKYYKRSLFTLLLVACNVIFLLVPFTNPFVIKVNIKPSKCWILLNFFSIKLYPCVLWWAKSNECFVSCCHACSINLVANIFTWFKILLISNHTDWTPFLNQMNLKQDFEQLYIYWFDDENEIWQHCSINNKNKNCLHASTRLKL